MPNSRDYGKSSGPRRRFAAGGPVTMEQRMTAEGYTPKYRTDGGNQAGGGLDENDPANIAQYYRLMNGGGAQPAATSAPATSTPAPAEPLLPPEAAAPARRGPPEFKPQTLTQTVAKAPPIPQTQNVQPYVKSGPVV